MLRLGKITYDDLQNYIKCPMYYLLDKQTPITASYSKYINLKFQELLFSIAKKSMNSQRIPEIEVLYNEIESFASIPPVNIISYSDKYKQRIIKQKKQQLDNFLKSIIYNGYVIVSMVNEPIESTIGSVVVETNIDLICKDPRVKKYYAVILDLSNTPSDQVTKEYHSKTILIWNYFNSMNTKSIVYWNDLLVGDMEAINMDINRNDYVMDLSSYINMMVTPIHCRRQGYWCNTCEYLLRGCHS